MICLMVHNPLTMVLKTERVSNVWRMREMFRGATSFNQVIGSWNVANVIEMHDMFEGATSFDQAFVEGWDVNPFD
jgi:Mycoplasma protein of unknown function, DUF285